ncbi:MAG: type II secretion system F family protein [Alphaproteobacteria bacterium]|nr:type II secretion system F family protein [Alphaproteobacteria bacterium]
MKTDYDLIINFSKQMYLISTTGQGYLAGLKMLEQSTKQINMRTLLQRIITQLEQTDIIDALNCSGTFDEFYLNMVKTGLYSGNLDEIFLHLANYYQRLFDNKKKFNRLLNYPFGIITLMMAVLLVMTTRILPVFNDLYTSMGSQLTGMARWGLLMGYFINDYLVYFLIIFLGAILVLLVLIKSNKVRIFAKAASLNRTANDLFAISTLVDAGVSFDQAAGLIDMGDSGILDAFSSRLEEMELTLLELSINNGTYEKVLKMLFSEYNLKAQDKMDESLEKFELYFGTGFVIIVAIILLSLILPLFAILAQL